MTLLRASTVLQAIGSSALPRSSIDANSGIQVYSRGGMFWSNKPMIMRNAPYTINNPTVGQIETRINFGHAGSSAKGQRGFAADGLPAVASAVRSKIAGYHAPHALQPEAYLSSNKHTVHTMVELEAVLSTMTRSSGAVALR